MTRRTKQIAGAIGGIGLAGAGLYAARRFHFRARAGGTSPLPKGVKGFHPQTLNPKKAKWRMLNLRGRFSRKSR